MTDTGTPTTWLEIARVFDGYDQQGYGLFDPDHPRVTDADEKARLLEFLDSGEIIMGIRARSHDQINPSRGPVVPMVFVTDGEWVWSKAVNYYLKNHDLLPESRFLGRIAAQDYQCPSVSENEVNRVFEEFQRFRAHNHVDGDRRIGPPPRR